MRKVVINTLICLVCTAIIFYLHFAVYDGMLLQEPFFTGSICAVYIVFALRSNIDNQNYAIQWNYPTAFLRIRLYQLLCCVISVSIPVILITEPYHFEYWFALTCIVVIALISKLHLKTVPAVSVTVMVTMLITMVFFCWLFIRSAHPTQKSWSNRPDTPTCIASKWSLAAPFGLRCRTTPASAAPCRRKRSRSAGTVSAPSKTEKDTAWSFRRHADRLKYRKNKEFNLYGIQNHHQTGRLGAEARRI